MAEVLQRKVIAVGERIFKEGEEASCAYLIQDGQIEIYREKDGQTMVLNTIGKGAIFGEMGLVDSKPRMASARAVSATTVVVVSRPMFQEKLAKTDPFVRALLNIFVETIRRQSK